MLIRFNVKNFLSFDERDGGMSEEFSMIAGKVRNKKSHIYDNGKIKLLKFAAIYGANASGKSNLIKALKTVTEFSNEDYQKMKLACKKVKCANSEEHIADNYILYFKELINNV